MPKAALFCSTTVYGATAINYLRILFLLISRKSAMLEASLFAGTAEAGTTGTSGTGFAAGLGSEGIAAGGFPGNGTPAACGLGLGLSLGLGHGLTAPHLLEASEGGGLGFGSQNG